MPDASIIVCTYNRAESLSETLAALAALAAGGLALEAVIVDNNSRDATRWVVEAWAARAPFAVRYVFEQRQGLSFARNTGIRHARGEIVAFTDDDVAVDRYWIRELVAALRTSDAAVTGGRILPQWAGPVPAWLTPELYDCLALLDHGSEPRVLGEPRIYGANFAVRRTWLRDGAFDPALGRVGDALRIGEEVAFIRDTMAAGGRVLYWPRAVVHHRIPPERMSKAYFRRWHTQVGEMQGAFPPDNPRRALAGIPYHRFKQAALGTKAWCAAGVRGESTFLHELRLRQIAGYMRVRARAHRRSRRASGR